MPLKKRQQSLVWYQWPRMSEEKVERRLAAIFAGDIAGYSRLMGLDEEGTLRQLKGIRKELVDPKITEHRGRIVKTTGDGILVEFVSVVDAVRCAVDIQRGMTERNADVPTDRRIEFRIGINVGDIIIDGGDIYGDGVNVAARLEALAQPNGILVSRAVHDQVQDKLSFNFEDIGEQSVKNITRPVRAFRIGVGEKLDGSSSPMPDAEAVWRRPAVAVLPFVNMSRDSEQDYFVDGLTEDIITALSYWRMFPVIARNSTFVYKGRAVNVQQIATELGAKYVIEGSVRKAGDQVRVTVQLIDAATGHHVWAERYDRKIDDIFALQDEISERIVATVTPELERAERKRSVAKQPNDLHAWDLFLRGMSQLYEFTKEGNERARDLFEQTVALDPTYSRGHTGLAYSHYRDVMFVFTDNDEHSIAKCLESAQRAVALDEADAFAHFVLSRGLHHAGLIERALDEAKLAIQLNPNDSGSHASLGAVLISAGQPNEGIAALQRAIQLSPKDTRVHVYLSLQSSGHFVAERYAEAAAMAKEVLTRHPGDATAQILLASSLASDGQTEEASTLLASGQHIDSSLIDRLGVTKWLAKPDRERLRKGLRQAGWPG